jgi:hypothetical protein
MVIIDGKDSGQFVTKAMFHAFSAFMFAVCLPSISTQPPDVYDKYRNGIPAPAQGCIA